MKMKFRLAGGVALVAAVALLAVGVVGSAFGATTTKGSAKAVTKVTVQAGEFYFKLSTKSIAKPGTVSFTVINKGKASHDFEIVKLHKKTALLKPGAKAVLTVTFAKPGSYQYICTVPGHAQAGMKGVFVVK